MELVATCALGLEEILAAEVRGLGGAKIERQPGAIVFSGGWTDVWRANWRLRTANRVLAVLGRWPAATPEALAAGAKRLAGSGNAKWEGLTAGALFDPKRTFAVAASSSRSAMTDRQWLALKVKDGLVDGQRERYGQRASIDRRDPDNRLRLFLHRDVATLLLDTSGEPLDRRGYRRQTISAPLREQIAAACVLASGWDGRGPVVDPMCGSGTLLAEAAWIAMGRAPGCLRTGWGFARLPGFDATAFKAVQAERLPAPGADVTLHGVDTDGEAIDAARLNLERAGLADRCRLAVGDGFAFEPPEGPGLLAINPPYGERLEEDPAQWRRLGDLMKQRYRGWRAVVLAGGPSRGKQIGLRPRPPRIPVRNGPLDARILTFELY